MTRIRFDDRRELSVLAPVDDESWRWTLRRAIAVAGESRARLTLIGVDDSWAAAADGRAATASRSNAWEPRDALRSLAFDARSASTSSSARRELGLAASEVAACASQRRVAAWGGSPRPARASSAPGSTRSTTLAGHGVADPARCCSRRRSCSAKGSASGRRRGDALVGAPAGRPSSRRRPPRRVASPTPCSPSSRHALGVEFLQEAA